MSNGEKFWLLIGLFNLAMANFNRDQGAVAVFQLIGGVACLIVFCLS